MRFHHVLEEVFGTAERVRVLRVLALYPKEFTSRELSGYSKVSVRGVIDILTLFERHGFVRSHRVGRSILWKLDKDHHLTRSLILPAFEAEGGLLDALSREISAIARKFPVRKIVIYGSVASGRERPDSDIDLLLVVNEKKEWLEELQNKLRERVLKLFGNMLSILVCTPSEYERMGGELRKEVERGMVVMGG